VRHSSQIFNAPKTMPSTATAFMNGMSNSVIVFAR
jgi:hypothetical protein